MWGVLKDLQQQVGNVVAKVDVLTQMQKAVTSGDACEDLWDTEGKRSCILGKELRYLITLFSELIRCLCAKSSKGGCPTRFLSC